MWVVDGLGMGQFAGARVATTSLAERLVTWPDLERVKGIEPSYEAWEAAVLPLNYTRVLIMYFT